ncbi:hypothetical protein F5H01DRAFT_82564 [Linnemannia elongata]|nr:hypothetical protein F5H01DRAFT_82564 [Linnemannia elongata]
MMVVMWSWLRATGFCLVLADRVVFSSSLVIATAIVISLSLPPFSRKQQIHYAYKRTTYIHTPSVSQSATVVISKSASPACAKLNLQLKFTPSQVKAIQTCIPPSLSLFHTRSHAVRPLDWRNVLNNRQEFIRADSEPGD